MARVFPVLLWYWAILIFIFWYPVTEWHIIGKIWWFANIPHHNWVDNHLIYRSIGSSDWQFYWTGITKIRIYLLRFLPTYLLCYFWVVSTVDRKSAWDTASGIVESYSPNQIKNVPVLRACVGFSKINSSGVNESLNAKITTDPCGKRDFHRFTN